MTTITSKEVPSSFVLCTVNDCPVASHCLRHLALEVLTKEPYLITVVNPRRTRPSEACEYYRSDEPQVFARGFASRKEEMLPRQYGAFMSRLKGAFGRTGYFERRRGERLCSPADIVFIQKVLADLGLSHLDFDGYERRYNWNE